MTHQQLKETDHRITFWSSMARTSLRQTSSLDLLKAMNDLGKLNGGRVVSIFSFISSALIGHFDIYWQCFRPVGDQTFFYQKRKLAKKLTTESLSDPNNQLLL
ncbi:hypothetical protein [Psychromonas sp. SA13A]|uniref:hypothetical protein n=1 Tax=Psychromonas sp. SA13A TaxID=2686346 RepID=UPI001409D22D|nr:hypothetical protein [Psychromonas sp. SA13A]